MLLRKKQKTMTDTEMARADGESASTAAPPAAEEEKQDFKLELADKVGRMMDAARGRGPARNAEQSKAIDGFFGARWKKQSMAGLSLSHPSPSSLDTLPLPQQRYGYKNAALDAKEKAKLQAEILELVFAHGES